MQRHLKIGYFMDETCESRWKLKMTENVVNYAIRHCFYRKSFSMLKNTTDLIHTSIIDFSMQI